MKSRKRRVILCLIAGPIGLLLLTAADQVIFKTIKARDAKVAYDEVMKKAQTEFDEKVLAAKKNYRARLEGAKGAVLQSGDLNEANKLQEEMKKLDQEIKDYKDTRPAGARGLVILRAQYGINGKWADVTELVRSRQKNDAVNHVPRLPDPIWGKSKTMIVEGTYGGKEFVLSFNQREPGDTLVFGAPSDELEIVRERE